MVFGRQVYAIQMSGPSRDSRAADTCLNIQSLDCKACSAHEHETIDVWSCATLPCHHHKAETGNAWPVLQLESRERPKVRGPTAGVTELAIIARIAPSDTKCIRPIMFILVCYNRCDWPIFQYFWSWLASAFARQLLHPQLARHDEELIAICCRSHQSAIQICLALAYLLHTFAIYRLTDDFPCI